MEALWRQFCCNFARNGTLKSISKYDETFIEDFMYYINTYVWDQDQHDFNKCFEKLIFIIVPHILAIIVQAYNYGHLNYQNLRNFLPKFKRTHRTTNQANNLSALPLDKWLYFKYHKSWWLAFSFTSGVMITWCAMHALFQSTLYYSTTTTEATLLTKVHNLYSTTKMTYWLTVHSFCLLTMSLFWASRLLLSRHTNIFPTPPPSFLINKKPINANQMPVPVKSFVCWYIKLIFFAPFLRNSRSSYDLMSDLKPLLALIRAGFIILISALPVLHTSVLEAISAYHIHRSQQDFPQISSDPSNNSRPIIQVVETGFVMGYFVVLATQLAILLRLLYRYIARFKQTELQFVTGTSSPTSTSQHSSSISSGCSTSSAQDNGKISEKVILFNEQTTYGSLGDARAPTVNIIDNSTPGPGWFSNLTLAYVSPSLKSIRVFGLSDPSRSLLPLPPNITSSNTTKSIKSGVNLVSLVKTTLGIKFFALGLVKLSNDLVGLACPLLLNRLIASLSPTSDNTTSHQSQAEAILTYGLGLAGAVLLSTFLTVHFDYQLGVLVLKTKSAIVNHLYGSVMSASLSDIAGVKIASALQNGDKKKKEKNGFAEGSNPKNEDLSVGEEPSSIQGSILSMLSTDVDRIVNFCSSFHACWSLPLQIMASLYLLYTQVGLTFLIGVVMVLAMIPINRCLATRISTYSSGMLSAKDARLRLLTYMLNAWRSVKALGLEPYFTRRVTEARERELKYVQRQKYLDALCVYFWATTPVIMSVSTFVTYVLYQQWTAAKSGGSNANFTLDAAKIFTSLALFNMLILPLNSLPWVINGLVEAWISLRRVQSLLNGLMRGSDHSELCVVVDKDQCDGGTDTKDELFERILVLERCSFRWSTSKLSTPPDLKDIDLQIDLGRPALIGVTGPIGSGKSSLLLALMNEMTLERGLFAVKYIDVNGKKSSSMQNVLPGTLKISYSGQKPWIQSASIRSNILFGNRYDPVRYARVLDALKLNEDFESMPNKDFTIVGESGASTLSGGQQTRISLARALYQEADLYLLDEPLASLDNVVGSWVFDRAIKQFLGHKIVVVATHLTRHLVDADVLWTMTNGSLLVKCRSDSGPIPSKNIAPIEDIQDDIIDQPTFDSTEGVLDKIAVANGRDNRIIDASIFLYYVKSMGLPLFIVIIISFTFMQLTRNGCDWWLAYYHFDSGNSTKTHPPLLTYRVGTDFYNHETLAIFSATFPTLNSSIRIFLVVYALLGISNSIFTLLRSFLFAYGGVKAARSCHAHLFGAVIRAKASNFWQNQAPLRAPNSYYDEGQEEGRGGSLVSRLVNRFSADTYIVDNNLPFLANILLSQIFGLIGTLAVGLWAQPWLGPLILPLFFIFYADLQAYYRTASREIKRWEASTRAPLLSRFEQSLRGKQYVRNFAPPSSATPYISSTSKTPATTSLERFEAEYALTVDTHVRACYNNLALGQWLNLRLQLFGVVFIVALVALIALQTGLASFILAPDPNYLPYSSLTSTGSGMLGLALSYFLVITGKLASLITVVVECEKEFISVERVKECADGLSLEDLETDVKHEGGGTKELAEARMSPPHLSHGEIRFQNVSVRYCEPVCLDDDESEALLDNPMDGLPPLALKNASFVIHPTEKIGIVGRTGAGKSTIFSVILKLVDLQDNPDTSAFNYGEDIRKSALYINGMDLAHIRPDVLRGEMISLVPQEPFLIPGSLRLNLDPARKFSDSAICQRLMEAGLYQKVILDMGGLDRPVMTNHEPDPGLGGENCVGGQQFYGELSLGQQQVISLARVVVNKNKIILIDEPTSNVDKETQDILTECIFHKAFAPCTVVVIAHRLETLKSCDRIMVLEKGRVIEFAPPNQLISDPKSKFSSFAKGVWSL